MSHSRESNSQLSLHTPESRLFVVSPCFNEAQGLPLFIAALQEVITQSLSRFGYNNATIVLVDDGSSDNTLEVIRNACEASSSLCTIVGIKLSRNFGHQAAIQAGVEYVSVNARELSAKDTIVIMDSDGQHPPELIPQLLEARRDEFQHIQMQRQNSGAGRFKQLSSDCFYWLFRKVSGLPLSAGSSDFRALSGHALTQYVKLSESGRFNRGLFYWIGFHTKSIPYLSPERTHGTTKYSTYKMLSLALRGFTYFSSKPLILFLASITAFGFIACFSYVLIEFIRVLFGAPLAPGWLTVIFSVVFWGSLLSLGQLLTAIYVARIFDEVKRRPLYVIDKVIVQ